MLVSLMKKKGRSLFLVNCLFFFSTCLKKKKIKSLIQSLNDKSVLICTPSLGGLLHPDRRCCPLKLHATACGLNKLLSSEPPWSKRLPVSGGELQEVSRCLPNFSNTRGVWGQALLHRRESKVLGNLGKEFFSKKQLCWNWPHRKQKPSCFQKDSATALGLLMLSHVSPLPLVSTGASPALYSSSPCSRSNWYPMALPLLSCSKSWPSSHP